MRYIQRTGAVQWIFYVGLALFAIFPSPSHADELDPSFGIRGRVTTPITFDVSPYVGREVALALAPDGKIVAAPVLGPPYSGALGGPAMVIRYLSNGRPDASFGSYGRLRIPDSQVPPNANFSLADIAVDSKGRVLVAGTTKANDWLGGSLITVMRFLPNGHVDPLFGDGGATRTNFGLSAPKGYIPNSSPGAVPTQPTLTADKMQIDSQGRIVLAGTVTVEVGSEKIGTTSRFNAPLVARLMPNGHPDTTFGTSGATALGDLATSRSGVNGLAIDSRGEMLVPICGFGYYGAIPKAIGVLRLHSDGTPDEVFGPNGVRETAGRPEAIAIDHSQRILVLSQPAAGFEYGGAFVKTLERWKASGLPDDHFGRGGVVIPKLRHGHVAVWQNLTTDQHGRVIAAGVLARQKEDAFSGLGYFGWKLETTHLLSTGQSDPRFGRHGEAVVGVGRQRNLAWGGRRSQIIRDARGRIIVAAITTAGKTGKRPALSLVRYRETGVPGVRVTGRP